MPIIRITNRGGFSSCANFLLLVSSPINVEGSPMEQAATTSETIKGRSRLSFDEEKKDGERRENDKKKPFRRLDSIDY